jgi:hypothetical protein
MVEHDIGYVLKSTTCNQFKGNILQNKLIERAQTEDIVQKRGLLNLWAP